MRLEGPAEALEERDVVIIVMGVSGAGKTTVGHRLAEALGWRFLDADDVHPPENIAKMTAGVALTDEDRAPWLAKLRGLIREALERDESLVLACSALKSDYRERLTVDDSRERWVYLHAPREVLAQRLSLRQGHFMPPALLDSQLADIEEPEGALSVDVSADPDTVLARVLAVLGLQKPA